jgi:hypothetical protein
MALQPNYSAILNLLNPQPNPSAGIKRYKERPEFVSMNPVMDAISPVETVQPSFQPSIASLFGETIGRKVSSEGAQLKIAQGIETKRLESDKKRRAKQDEYTKKAEDIRKKPKVKRDEALIGGLIALLGAAGGATNAPQSLQNYLGGVSDRRSEEQNNALTALERQMQSELGMMDDQVNADQLQGKYALQYADMQNRGFKGVDKARADKKEDARVKAEKLAEIRLGNIGEAIMKAKNPAETESWIEKYNAEAVKSGKPPIDEAQRFVIMESANQKTLADAKEIAYFKAAYDPIDRTIKRYEGAKMPPEVVAELQTRINELNAWGAPRGLTLPSIDPNATPEWEMKAEKALRDSRMWDVDFENKKQEGVNKKLTAQKTRVDIEAVNQKIREGKATAGDIIYKDFLEGKPVGPDEVKSYLKDKAKVLDNSFETAGSTDPNKKKKGVLNIRLQLDEMAGFLGPDHSAVKQAFARSEAQGYLDPKYKGMDHAAFSKYWRDGKAKADALGSLLQKKKSAPEAINGYQKVERNGKQVIRTGNGIEYPLGVPYVWGGSSSKGADCSGIVCASLSKSGIKVGRTTAAGLYESKDFFDVSGQMYNPDDLLFFDTKSTHGKNGIDHVAVYIGNGMMFHAPSKGKPSQIISVDKYLKSGAKFLGARRHTKLK